MISGRQICDTKGNLRNVKPVLHKHVTIYIPFNEFCEWASNSFVHGAAPNGKIYRGILDTTAIAIGLSFNSL